MLKEIKMQVTVNWQFKLNAVNNIASVGNEPSKSLVKEEDNKERNIPIIYDCIYKITAGSGISLS